MTRVIVTQPTLDALGGLMRSVELCDESGQTLGYFHPTSTRCPDLFDLDISEEELHRREQEGGGRTLDVIMAELEGRQ